MNALHRVGGINILAALLPGCEDVFTIEGVKAGELYDLSGRFPVKPSNSRDTESLTSCTQPGCGPEPGLETSYAQL